MSKTMITAGGIALFAALPLRADSSFLEGFPDVPLLNGFAEQAEDRMIFDTVAGTIAETVLTSPHSDALDRYESALKGLGWSCPTREVARLSCMKDHQNLSLLLLADGTSLIVRVVPSGG